MHGAFVKGAAHFSAEGDFEGGREGVAPRPGFQPKAGMEDLRNRQMHSDSPDIVC